LAEKVMLYTAVASMRGAMIVFFFIRYSWLQGIRPYY